MTDRKAKSRALHKAGFAIPQAGWMRAEDAARLQRQIDRAVKAAADEVKEVWEKDHD